MIKLDENIDDVIKIKQESFKGILDDLNSQYPEVLSPQLVEKVEKVYLTGCGDSYFAALAAHFFFERVTGLDVEPIEAMEFSRYAVKYMPTNSLVLGISNSGRVSRTTEAIIQARKRGAYTIALTGFRDRIAAQEANAALVTALPNVRAALEGIITRLAGEQQEDLLERLSEPGMMSKLSGQLGIGTGIDFLLFMLGAYLGSLTQLYSASIHIGLTLDKLNGAEAAKLEAEILRSVEIIVRTSYGNLDRVTELAKKFQQTDTFTFIGAGPNYATACLSAAKIFEQLHLNGVAHQLEEWAHLGFFFTRPDGPPLFVLAPPGESLDRAMELINGIRDLGGTVIAICDENDSEIIEIVDGALLIHGRQDEAFTPWTYGVPGQILALTLLDLRGQPPIPSPYSFKQMMKINFNQIYESKIKKD
jgi:glucosamine--fructose-6-phosphate aminotransferase (isomerizing)